MIANVIDALSFEHTDAGRHYINYRDLSAASGSIPSPVRGPAATIRPTNWSGSSSMRRLIR